MQTPRATLRLLLFLLSASVAQGQQVEDDSSLVTPFLPDHDQQTGRSVGMGDPLVGTSWRNRPFHVGWMFGGLFGDDLIAGRIAQHEDIVGGYRAGWDFDHYWGVEGRFVFANLDFTDQANLDVARTARNHYWDADVLFYPWGDSRWRPYASVGAGWATFEFRDGLNQQIEKTLFAIPIGGGLKYFWKNWLAVRFSVTDNWAIGRDPLDSMHNVSVTGDVEVHFGGRRRGSCQLKVISCQ